MPYETAAVYLQGRFELERQGFAIKAAVVDGRRGTFDVFYDVPAQMCQFHQIQIVRRYLTGKPKLQASQELWAITKTLAKADGLDFCKSLDNWHKRWAEFLKERTVDPETKHWFYTHKRLRSAYHSLKFHLPHLFTYQRFPELAIPNTTNCLDGAFSNLKTMLQIHRGLKRSKKQKLIDEILSN